MNDSGQVLIIMLLITSLLIGILGFSVGFIKWTQVKNNTETICRKHYLKSQSYVVKYAARLKKLNSKATKLRIRLARLYMKLALLKDPISISAVLWRIKQLKTKQNILDAKQKSIILLAKYKIKVEIKRLKKNLNSIENINIEKVQSVPFNMVAKPPMFKAPTYHLPKNFKTIQTATASWNWTEITYLKKIFNFNCSVGVKKKGLKWQPIMKRAKPLLNL